MDSLGVLARLPLEVRYMVYSDLIPQERDAHTKVPVSEETAWHRGSHSENHSPSEYSGESVDNDNSSNPYPSPPPTPPPSLCWLATSSAIYQEAISAPSFLRRVFHAELSPSGFYFEGYSASSPPKGLIACSDYASFACSSERNAFDLFESALERGRVIRNLRLRLVIDMGKLYSRGLLSCYMEAVELLCEILDCYHANGNDDEASKSGFRGATQEGSGIDQLTVDVHLVYTKEQSQEDAAIVRRPTMFPHSPSEVIRQRLQPFISLASSKAMAVTFELNSEDAYRIPGGRDEKDRIDEVMEQARQQLLQEVEEANGEEQEEDEMESVDEDVEMLDDIEVAVVETVDAVAAAAGMTQDEMDVDDGSEGDVMDSQLHNQVMDLD